jgi:hypothetical protein
VQTEALWLLGFQVMSLVLHETVCERHWDGRLAIVVLSVMYFGWLVGVGLYQGSTVVSVMIVVLI